MDFDEFNDSRETRRADRIARLLSSSSEDHLRHAAELTAEGRRADEITAQLLWAIAKQGRNQS